MTVLIPLALLTGLLSEAEAVRTAIATHPLLAAAAERTAAAGGRAAQAALRPNPHFVFQSENWRRDGAAGERDTFAYLTQPIELGGKRQRRIESAAASLRRAEFEKELLARQIAGRVRQAYWAAAGAERIQELWLENVRNFQQIVGYHEARVKEGAMAEADLIKVQLEAGRQALAANSAALEAGRARIQLLREMGQKDFAAVRFADALEASGPPPAADIERALAERTEIRLARQSIDLARANAREQQAARTPNLDFSVGLKRTAGFNTLMGGVNLPLPLFNRNQGAINGSAAEVRAAESELAAALALVRAEVEAAGVEVEIRHRQMAALLASSLERAQESSRIARAAYVEGGADLLRLLDAERVRIEMEVLYARSLAEFRQSVAALETAMGVIP